MKVVMLVSASAGGEARRAVDGGLRPVPEFLVLERDYGVTLLDWSSLGMRSGRSVARSVRHAAAALRAAPTADVLFSDGEHVGIPLGIGLETIGPRRPHVVLGHHLTSRSKPVMLRWLRHMGITRMLVHSRAQLELAVEKLGFRDGSVAFVPYSADAGFWSPRPLDEETLIVSAGREHRDFATLASAVREMPVKTVIAAGSLFSPGAPWRMPEVIPDNVSIGMRTATELRDLYARSQIVVVPLIDSDFQAGVTTILEAMAMAKPVVVTATRGQRDVIRDGETGLLVPPYDAGALRETLDRLLSDPAERRRLGANARDAVRRDFDVPVYAGTLYGHLVEAARTVARAA